MIDDCNISNLAKNENQEFTITVPLFTQVHKWVLANLLLGDWVIL